MALRAGAYACSRAVNNNRRARSGDSAYFGAVTHRRPAARSHSERSDAFPQRARASVRTGEYLTPMSNRPAVLPLRDVVVFPYVAMPLLVGRQASLAAIEAAAAESGTLFLVTQKSADTEAPAAGDLQRVG